MSRVTATPRRLRISCATNRVWPLFAKPVQGAYGKGTALIEGYDARNDSLVLAHEASRPVEDYVSHLQNPGRLGFLFQEVLAPHPALEPICGKRLSSVRAMTVYPASGAALHRVIWKIPVGRNITDNYQHGVAGNLIAAVDPESGIAAQPVLGIGLNRHVVERHPDTSAVLRGFALPQWDVLKDVVLRGTRALPGLRWQHWDIAFAREGPTVLEVNLYAGGGTDIAQVSHGNGLLDETLSDSCRTPHSRTNSGSRRRPRSTARSRSHPNLSPYAPSRSSARMRSGQESAAPQAADPVPSLRR